MNRHQSGCVMVWATCICIFTRICTYMFIFTRIYASICIWSCSADELSPGWECVGPGRAHLTRSGGPRSGLPGARCQAILPIVDVYLGYL